MMTAYEALQACDAWDSHQQHLDAHRAFWDGRKPTLHDGWVRYRCVPYVEFPRTKIPRKDLATIIRWGYKGYIQALPRRPWFSYGPICFVLAYSLSGCAHGNHDAATVAVSIAEIAVDIMLGLAQ